MSTAPGLKDVVRFEEKASGAFLGLGLTVYGLGGFLM